jgi:hypothetical protein
MIELINISFKEYFYLDDRSEYDYAIRYAYKFNQGIDNFGFGDFMKLSFGLVKDLQYDLQNGLTWEQIIDYMILIKNVEYGGNTLLEMCQQRQYMVNEIERISKVEAIALSHESTDEEVRAGIEDFEPLGNYLQFRQLAITFSKSIDEVRAWPYELCFTELVAQKKLNDYEKRYTKIILERHK